MKKFKLILIGTIAAISLIGLQSCKDKEVEVTGITLNKTNITLEVGSTETIKAVVTPEDATDQEVKWTTSNDKIATVKGGKVTAVAEGTAIITATAGGEEATCVMKVIPKEEEINLPTIVMDTFGISENSMFTWGAGSISMTATVISDGGSPVTERGMEWGDNPPFYNNTKDSGTGIGTFSLREDGIGEQGGIIRFRAYATNEKGTAYSEWVVAFDPDL